MATPALQPIANNREDSVFRFLGLPTAIRATSESTRGNFVLVEQWSVPPGFASPYHVHHAEDEAFYILEGEVAFVCGDKWIKAGPGAYLFGPREIPHGFKIIGATPARLLLLAAPGGFERFIRELAEPVDAAPTPPDIPKLIAIAAKHKIDILGPLPEHDGF